MAAKGHFGENSRIFEDTYKIEKIFLSQNGESLGAGGEGPNNQPITKFNPLNLKQLSGPSCPKCPSSSQCQYASVLKYIESHPSPAHPSSSLVRYAAGGGDSEVENASSIYTTTTEDDILLGESATDWQNLKYKNASTCCASFSHLRGGYGHGDDSNNELLLVDLDQELQSPAIITRKLEIFDPLTVGEWADQLPSIPGQIFWRFSDLSYAFRYLPVILGGFSLALIYRLFRSLSR